MKGLKLCLFLERHHQTKIFFFPFFFLALFLFHERESAKEERNIEERERRKEINFLQTKFSSFS